MLTKHVKDRGYEKDPKKRRVIGNCSMADNAGEAIVEDMVAGKVTAKEAQKKIDENSK